MSIPEFLENVNDLCNVQHDIHYAVAQPVMLSSTNSVSVDGGEDTSPNTEPLRSTTLNVPQLQSCYLCWRHAEHIYITTPWRDFPSEECPLCRLHWLVALGVHLESVFIRKQVYEDYVHGESEEVA